MTPRVFRSRFNRVVAGVVWLGAAALCAAGLAAGGASSVVSGDASPGASGGELATFALAALLAFTAWATLWHPRVSVGDDGVELRNVTHTVLVPWDAVIEVDTKYSLTVRTPRRVYSAWAAPAPGRYASRNALRTRAMKATADDGDPLRIPVGGARTSDLPSTDSGDAAAIVRAEWQRRLDGGLIAIGGAETARVAVRVHAATLAALVALGAAFVLAAIG